MRDVKTGDLQISEFKSRTRLPKRSSDGLLLWMNVWLCLITVILLFQTAYPIIMAHRAERKVEEYLEQLGNVSSLMDGAEVDDRMKMLERAFQEEDCER